jgi:hypothetical protein
MKIFNYLEKSQISLEISGEFCAEIVRAGVISAHYQIAFCFLVCTRFYWLVFSELEKLSEVPSWGGGDIV